MKLEENQTLLIIIESSLYNVIIVKEKSLYVENKRYIKLVLWCTFNRVFFVRQNRLDACVTGLVVKFFSFSYYNEINGCADYNNCHI